MLLLASAAASSLVTPTALTATAHTLDRLYASDYAERLTIGRRAQLGDDLIYRPGAISTDGSDIVDSALTYGEYDLGFFSECIDCALEHTSASPTRFVDVGSGVGRLVLAATMLWPNRFACCSGVETVAELHRLALVADAALARHHDIDASLLPPRRFVCGDAADDPEHVLSDSDVVFAYCSTWASEGDALSDFSAICGTHLRPGAVVITTDRKLLSVDGLWRFLVLEQREGRNMETGGSSVAFVQEVVESRRGA